MEIKITLEKNFGLKVQCDEIPNTKSRIKVRFDQTIAV